MSKSAAKKKAKEEPAKTEMRDLPVKLNSDQIADRAREAADLMDSISDAQEAAKEEASRRKGIIAGLEAEAAKLWRTIQSGRELQPVKCTVSLDYVSGTATITRDDTGEVVDTRGLTEEEKAPKLGLMVQLPPPPPPEPVNVTEAVAGVGPVQDLGAPKLTEAQRLQADEAKWQGIVSSAIEVLRDTNRAALSTIQRKLGLRPETAIKVMEELERRGIVGPPRGEAPREILNLPEPATS